jgi:hypothetical protein
MNRHGRLASVYLGLSVVAGHLSPVDAGLTAVGVDSAVVEMDFTKVDAPSSLVETARLNVEARRATMDFASTVIRVNPRPPAVLAPVAAGPWLKNWLRACVRFGAN